MSGYKIVDLKDINVETSGGTIIDGIYEQIEGNYRKPVLLSGITIDGHERPSRFTVFGVDGTDFVSDATISAGTMLLRCRITSDDLVTWEEE